MPADSSAILWAFLSGAFALLVILLALGVALILYQRRFVAMHRDFAHGLVRAQEEERAWVAREVHDDALQRITLLLQELDEVTDNSSPGADRRRSRLAALRREIEDLSVVLRRLAYRLHPAFVGQEGIVEALRRLAADVSRGASTVRLEVLDEGQVTPVLSEAQTLVVYRIVQEALTNLVRHAGPGTGVVRVRTTAAQIELDIEDRGRGFDTASTRPGLGLISMTERARAAGGVLTVDSRPGTGTRVRLRLPLDGRVN